MGERATPDEDGNAVTLEALHADYEVWCVGKGLQAMTVEAFAESLDRMREVPELAGNIKRVGNRYYGLKLVDAKLLKLPVARRGSN
jgi:hypothetical protein